MDFRIPHPFENIGDAIKDAFDPLTPATGDAVTQLMNENNRAIEDAISNLGKIGGYELRDVNGVVAGTGELITWTPPDGGVFSTSVRVFSQNVPSGSLATVLACELDGDSSGAPRGNIRVDLSLYNVALGEDFAAIDIGLTASGVEATFGFEFTASGATDPIDFRVEIISVPFAV